MKAKYYVDCNGVIYNTENPPDFCHLEFRTEGTDAPYEVVDVVDSFHNILIETYALWDEIGLYNALKRRFEFNED